MFTIELLDGMLLLVMNLASATPVVPLYCHSSDTAPCMPLDPLNPDVPVAPE